MSHCWCLGARLASVAAAVPEAACPLVFTAHQHPEEIRKTALAGSFLTRWQETTASFAGSVEPPGRWVSRGQLP